MRQSYLISCLLLTILSFTILSVDPPSVVGNGQISPYKIQSSNLISQSYFTSTEVSCLDVADSNNLPTSIPAAPSSIQTILDQITTSSYTSQVSHLSSSIGSRIYGSVGNTLAVEYIANEFRDFGLDVSYHYFGPGEPNVIGTLPGASLRNNECIIVGAHLDTYPTESRGADDNGSGIGAILEMAKAMSQYQYNYTIMFVAFNQEEVFLAGSSAFVNKLSDENVTVAVMYNFDMIMWDSPASTPNLKMNIVHNGGSSEWFATHAATIGKGWLGAPIQAFLQPYWVFSDHKPFWDRGIPGVWFFEFDGLSNPYIHSVQDTLSQSEYSPELGTITTKTAAAAVADFATIVSTQPGFPQIDFITPLPGAFIQPTNQVPIVLSVNDGLDDINHLDLSINNGPWINATSGLNNTHCTYILDASGMYGSVDIKARAYDAEGWISRTSTSFIFDKGIYCEIHTPSDDEVLNEGELYTIWVNVSDPDGRFIPSVQIRIDEASWESTISFIQNQEYYYEWLPMGSGPISIEARVVDANGNRNSSRVSVLLMNYPPIITSVQASPQQPLDTDNVVITAIVTQDNRGSGINQVLVYYSIDYSFWKTRLMHQISSDTYQATIDPYPAGSYIRFYINARDNFDNIAINNNNGIYYSYTVGANLTTVIILGAVISIIVAIGLIYYFFKHRRHPAIPPT